MYDLLTKISQKQDRAPHQPEYPLVYDTSHGPWKPILTKEGSLNQDFKFLILTEPGEWPHDPELGVGIRKYLFEPYQSQSLKGIQSRIQDQLERYLPRIKLISAEFTNIEQQKQEHSISLKIRYSIMGTVEKISKIQLDEKGYLSMEDEITSKIGDSISNIISPLSSKMKVI